MWYRLEEIRRSNGSPETSETLKTRIEDIKKKHLEEVRTLYEWHAQDYYDEMVYMAQSKPDCQNADVEVCRYTLCTFRYEAARSRRGPGILSNLAIVL